MQAGTADELKKKARIEEKVTVEVNNLKEEQIDKIRKLQNVEEVKYNVNNLIITYKQGENNLGELTNHLKQEEIKYNKIYSERPTLNDVFLELTGKELRD